ncbi:dsDNA nuclease domain-containing protein [Solibacillus sp. FSL R5-0691]|uniref:dsDNA nuclease domain-containing protein n=1 Tax=Solibacillus sp. FSL R5-0691 TaxID=2921653 RepID=UPI0030D5A510
MVSNEIIDSIINLADENGGDSATDGFEFQMSTAIYLLFNEILINSKNNINESILIYEKVEDFIIFNDRINLYQAKSTSRSLTPNLLYSPGRKTEADDSGLSIIEKMNVNYLKVKDNASNTTVLTTLIVCENQRFSKKLSNSIEGIEDLREINFNDLSETVKEEIINKTQFGEYDWTNINARRIIPKSRHEEVTRVYIEDVVSEMLGENKINSAALYTSLTYEIKKIRRNKTKLSSNFLQSKITQFSEIESTLKFNDYVYLLNDQDRRNIKIAKSFTQIQNNLMIKNHPVQNDYSDIKKLFTMNEFEAFDEVIDTIENSSELKLMRLRLSDHEIKALALIVMLKEVIT